MRTRLEVRNLGDDAFEFYFETPHPSTGRRQEVLVGRLYVTQTGVYQLQECGDDGTSTTMTLSTDRTESIGRAVVELLGL